MNPDITAPITVCGNAVGDAEADCPAGGATPPGGPGGPDGPEGPKGPAGPEQPTGDRPTAAPGPNGDLAVTGGATENIGIALLGLMFLLSGFGVLRLSTRRARTLAG